MGYMQPILPATVFKMGIGFFNKMEIDNWRTTHICVFLPSVRVVPSKAGVVAAWVLLDLNFQPKEKALYNDPSCLNKVEQNQIYLCSY